MCLTSKYLEEKKSTEIPLVAASERGTALKAGCQALTSTRAAVVGVEVWGVGPDGAATGADLGGSSKYANENFED